MTNFQVAALIIGELRLNLCLFFIFAIKKNKFIKINSKCYFQIMLCWFLRNFKVVGKNPRSYGCYKLSVFFCISGIEKLKYSTKNYKSYFRIKLCMFMTNFKVISQKRSSYDCFTFCVFFAFLVLKNSKFEKNIF